jgi:transposase-like protein
MSKDRDVAVKQVQRDLYINEHMLAHWISEFSEDSHQRFERSPKPSTSLGLL